MHRIVRQLEFRQLTRFSRLAEIGAPRPEQGRVFVETGQRWAVRPRVKTKNAFNSTACRETELRQG